MSQEPLAQQATAPETPAAAAPASRGSSPLQLLNRARLAFRRFRRTRPFWAALWTMLGGYFIFIIPMTGLNTLVKTGLPGIGGVAIGVTIAILGLFLMFAPGQRHVVSVIVAVLALVSFPVSNLGGFVVGMLCALVGASMGFGWMAERPVKKRRWGRRIPQAAIAPAVVTVGPATEADTADPAAAAVVVDPHASTR